MSRIGNRKSNGKAAVLEALKAAQQATAAALALLEHEDDAQPQHDADELVDAKSNPLGSEWQFRRLIREGKIPGFKLGRKLVARKADVLAWVESQQIAPKAPAAKTLDEWDEQMREGRGG